MRGTENHDWDRFAVRNVGFNLKGNRAALLSLMPEQIIRAKSAPEETTYLKLLQKNQELRRELIRLGSISRSGSRE
jgi:hypothetical protein